MKTLQTTIPAIEGPRTTSALIAVLFLAIPGPAWPQSVERVAQDRVSVHAQDVPLGRLLRELAEVIPVDRLIIENNVESIRINVSLPDATFKDGILEIIKAADVSYVIQGGDGEPFRIFVGNPEGPVLNQILPGEPAESELEPLEPEAPEPDAPMEDIDRPEDTEPSQPLAPQPLAPQPLPPQPLRPRPPPQVTGGARLLDEPDSRSIAMTVTLLGLGLLLGVPLVRPRSAARTRGS